MPAGSEYRFEQCCGTEIISGKQSSYANHALVGNVAYISSKLYSTAY